MNPKRDYTEDEVEDIRRLILDDPAIVLGGQGRSSDEVKQASVWFGVAIATAILLFVFALMSYLNS